MKTKKKIAIIILCTLLGLGATLGAVVGIGYATMQKNLVQERT